MATFKITSGVLTGDTVSDGNGSPPGIWGGGNEPFPTPPIVIPPDAIAPGVPAHPIYLPVHIWGGGNEPFPTPPIVIPIPPDAISPGVPAHPIYIPVYPAHPIVIPPEAIGPGVPTHPIVLPPYIPAHPIVIPPDSISPGVPAHPIVLPPESPDCGKWVYTVVHGWVWDPGKGGKPQPLPPGDTATTRRS